MGAGSTPKLSIEELSVTYVDRRGRSVHAVDRLNLSVANKPGVGELAVFLGPSGCGKSTVLKAIAGLLAPDSGRVLVDGAPVSGTGRDRGMVGAKISGPVFPHPDVSAPVDLESLLRWPIRFHRSFRILGSDSTGQGIRFPRTLWLGRFRKAS